ncbi:MAG: penicillin-binding protein 1A [Proteobacteria bacterium]|nr:penicillin-binding protein 1A [Pseudomonadota bacterium]
MKLYQRILYLAASTAIIGGFVFLMIGVSAYLYLAPSLPDVNSLRDVRLQVPLRVYSRDGRLISQLGAQRRIPIAFEDIPQDMVNAFLAAEDDRFFEHPGVDYQGLVRATMMLLLTGERRQGGGTITMQLARNFFLTRERTYIRKLKEIFLALRIETQLNKQEILTLYLNKIFLGQRAYGVGAASEVYFGKALKDLKLPEIATIAGLPKAPSSDNPVSNPERAGRRRAYVLRRMLEVGYIEQDEADAAAAIPIESRIHGPAVEVNAPYIAEMVRSELLARNLPDIYTAGYRVTTSIDSRLQKAAVIALRQALLEYDARHGYRGPEDRLTLFDDTDDADQPGQPGDAEPADLPLREIEGNDPLALEPNSEQLAWADALETYPEFGNLAVALVLSTEERQAEVYVRDHGVLVLPWQAMSWARPYIDDEQRGEPPETAADIMAPGDVIRLVKVREGWRLTGIPEVQGALTAMDPQDGAIVALSGGFDFFASKYNRAVQAKRQPGSSFKPFIYSAALAEDYTPATIINDAPVVFEDVTLERTWRPKNYIGRFYGPTRMREALVKSRNLVSIRILMNIGIPYAVRYLERFGFPRTALPRDLSLALGSATLTPLQMVTAYSIFANGGFETRSYLIQRIDDASGSTIYQADPQLACMECEQTWNQQQADRERALELSGSLPPPDDDEHLEEPEIDLDELTEDPLIYLDPTLTAPRVIEARNAYLIADMMREVIRRGTGRRAMALGRRDLSGKTGTTNDGVDVWFSGYNSRLVATAWVGFDNPRPLGTGEEGSRTALPMWMDFMQVALQGMPDSRLPVPDGLISVRISPDTGCLAGSDDPSAMFEILPREKISDCEPGNININNDDDEEKPDEEDLF